MSPTVIATHVLLYIGLPWGAAAAVCGGMGQEECPANAKARSLLQRTQHGAQGVMVTEEGGAHSLEALQALLPQLVSTKKPLNSASLLETVRSLANERVTPEVAAFANRTIEIINGLLVTLQGAHDSDLELLRGIYAGFATLASALESDLATIAGQSNTVAGLRNTTRSCRAEESFLYSKKEESQFAYAAALEAAMAAKEAMVAAAKAMIAADQFDAETGHTRENIHALKSFAEDLYTKTGAYLRALGVEEATLNASSAHAAAHAEQLAECTSSQGQLEQATCSLVAASTSGCGGFTSGYQMKVDDYNAVVASTQPKEADRKQEYIALTRINCVLRLLATAEEGAVAASSAQIQECFSQTVVTDSLDIVYNATPTEAACPSPPPAPCSDAYLAAEYSNLPPDTQAATCMPCP